MAKIKNWYEAQSNTVKLLIAFLGNCVYWLLVHYIMSLVWEEMGRSVMYHVMYALWMGATWTLVFHWALVKKVFKKNPRTQEPENA